MTQIIAALIVTIVIEFDAETTVRAAMQARQKTLDSHARAQFEIIDSGEYARVQKIRSTLSGHPGFRALGICFCWHRLQVLLMLD
jgi:hypothetical protein